jgi:SAM-dependent methyltransferase
VSQNPEFDQYADEYKKLTYNPIREKFGPGSDFFHRRKWELLSDYLDRARPAHGQTAWLDVGCGKGELLRLGAARFGQVKGCDISSGMLDDCGGIEVVPQTEATRLPFADQSFDLVTAVCVYHHVEPPDRSGLTGEIGRVLKPKGTACIIEHNPFNPVTQWIVSRIPVDANAKLLTPGQSRRLLSGAGLEHRRTTYFLYFPESLYERARRVESWMKHVPAGGQYAVFAQRAA